MLQCSVHEDADDSIVNGIRVARDAMVKLKKSDVQGELQRMINQAKSKYPRLATQLDQVCLLTLISSTL
jgi:hypothetical protein